MNKKLIYILFFVIVIVLLIVGVVVIKGNNKNSIDKNIEGSLESIMEKMYTGISEDELPMLSNTEVNAENVEYYLGTSDIQFTEGLASEPLMTSIAHSVVLIRVENDSDIKEIVDKIKNNVDPNKWICVGVDEQNVRVENKGNLILLVMTDENVDTIVNNFKNL